MPITNPEAIAFSNQVVRPLCEEARALVAKINAAATTWFGGVNALFPNDTSELEDQREAEGVSRLTGANVNSAVGVLIAMRDASNAEIISKPCVRPLDAS